MVKVKRHKVQHAAQTIQKNTALIAEMRTYLKKSNSIATNFKLLILVSKMFSPT